MKTAKYFKEAEFRACSPSCSIEDMEADFLHLLDMVREKAGIPLVLNCAYRSEAWDKAKGRSGKSAHTYGLAVDIRCGTSQNRMRIVRAALECGITRIGVYPSWVHLDIGERVGLPKGVLWIGDARGNQIA